MSVVGSFLIHSLAATGMQPALDTNQSSKLSKDLSADSSIKWEFKRDRSFTLAAHRSHASHGSHGSHRSSAGGGVTPKSTPNYVTPKVQKIQSQSDSTPPNSILPRSPATSPKITKLNGNSKAFRVLVMHVQTVLYATGHYSDAIDGLAGPNTVSAIAAYEVLYGLPVTGRLSDALLDLMNIDTFLIEKQIK